MFGAVFCFFVLYCGLVDEVYVYENNYELVQKGIGLMYQDRAKKSSERKAKRNALIGNKGNTPVELQETETRKYRSTMWYSIIDVTITSPVYKQAKIYVFPTKFCKPLESVPLIAVVDDMINYRVFYAKNIEIGISGLIFSLNARFNREGHLNTSIFQTSTVAGSDEKNSNCKCEVDTIEGDCVPANFGKRVGKDEIYPIKKNIQGLCDFVLFKNCDTDNPTVEVVTDGTIIKDDVQYGVYIDDNSIDLVPM